MSLAAIPSVHQRPGGSTSGPPHEEHLGRYTSGIGLFAAPAGKCSGAGSPLKDVVIDIAENLSTSAMVGVVVRESEQHIMEAWNTIEEVII